jgi:nucleotide-binding universal stress UspA family protein
MSATHKAVPQFTFPPRHIACATDLAEGTRDAERAAFSLASRFGARLTFLSVDPTFVYHAELLASSGGLTSPSFDPAKQKAYLEKNAQELRSHLTPLSEGVAFEVVTDSGDPSLSLLQWIHGTKETPVDLVVVGRKRRGAIQSFFMGSTSTNLLEEAGVPVLMVPEEGGKAALLGTHVVLATDLAAPDRRASQAAGVFAKALNAHVTLVHSYQTQDYRPLPPDYFASEDVYHELTTLVANACRIKTDHLQRDTAELSLAHGVRAEAKLLEGRPRETILEYVREASPALLVVGRGATTGGLGSLLLGSTARALAMHAQSPVLVVPHSS